MIEVKNNISNLVTNIYECQKKIIINKRFIRELENEGSDSAKLRNEVKQLEKRIEDYQRELRRKYQLV